MRFTDVENNHHVEMIGTYSTFPEVNWAVIAQRSLSEARADAGVTELNRQALTFVSHGVLIAIVVVIFSLWPSPADSRAGRFHPRH